MWLFLWLRIRSLCMPRSCPSNILPLNDASVFFYCFWLSSEVVKTTHRSPFMLCFERGAWVESQIGLNHTKAYVQVAENNVKWIYHRQFIFAQKVFLTFKFSWFAWILRVAKRISWIYHCQVSTDKDLMWIQREVFCFIADSLQKTSNINH